jgi:hypothetical protein
VSCPVGSVLLGAYASRVAIGDWNEDELREAVRREMRGSDLATLVRQVQGSPVHRVGDAGEPAFKNGWVNFDAAGAGARDARFYRDHRRVYLEGVIKSGTINTPAFTLPPGFLPAENQPAGAQIILPAVSNAAFGALFIANNGDVQPAIGSNVYFSLDGISFRVAT